MVKMYKYRIYPTKKQKNVLQDWLEECRWLYNHLLEQRITSYKDTGKGPSCFEQQARFPALKEERPSLKIVHSQVLQNVALRIDLAFKAFFRRVKAKENPGFPRFKAFGRYQSITFPQFPSGCVISGDILILSKIGKVLMVKHRELIGKVKTCTVSVSSTGKWYACFSTEIETTELPVNNQIVGIDVGIKTFATLSNGDEVVNPKFFKQEQKALAKAQRRHAKLEKGTPKRRKHRLKIARIHERISWRRDNFTHQEARKIVNVFGLIFVEDLEVNRMVHDHCFAKSISDAAWSQFFSKLSSKAVEAGRELVKVNPAYTSQTCSKCGHRQPMPVDVRTYHCLCCNLSLDRDLNAALNIKAAGLRSVGLSQEAPAFQAGE